MEDLENNVTADMTNITLDVSFLRFDKETKQYEIKINGASLIALSAKKQTVRLLISEDCVHPPIGDDPVDTDEFENILKEIEEDNEDKNVELQMDLPSPQQMNKYNYQLQSPSPEIHLREPPLLKEWRTHSFDPEDNDSEDIKIIEAIEAIQPHKSSIHSTHSQHQPGSRKRTNTLPNRIKVDNSDEYEEKKADVNVFPNINVNNGSNNGNGRGARSSSLHSLGNQTPLSPKKHFGNKKPCSRGVGECQCVERVIFMLKYFVLWVQHKRNRIPSAAVQDYKSMKEFTDALKGYKEIKLLNDFYHILRNHSEDSEFIAYIQKTVPSCKKNSENDDDFEGINGKKKVPSPATPTSPRRLLKKDGYDCICLKRNKKTSQVYGKLSDSSRRSLYMIDDSIEARSLLEMDEINLQQMLDCIHCCLIHNVISAGEKFVTMIEDNESDYDDYEEEYGRFLMMDEYNVFFDYWKPKNEFYCASKYSNLREELCNNCVHKLVKEDYQLLHRRAIHLLESEKGKYWKAQREFRWMKNCIKLGDPITLDHMIAILIHTNYSNLSKKLKHFGCIRRSGSLEKFKDTVIRNGEIAIFCKLLKEAVYCYGDVLPLKQRVYHGMSSNVMFKRIGMRLDMAVSATTRYSVAQQFAKHNSNSVLCLKLGQVTTNQVSDSPVFCLDVSDVSCYPIERERILYGSNLDFLDIIYDGEHHGDMIMALMLYEKIINGTWFTENSYIFKKKYQRIIIKMIQDTMKFEKQNGLNPSAAASSPVSMTSSRRSTSLSSKDMDYMDDYIQNLFVSVNDNKCDLWFNRDECDKLLQDLQKCLFKSFVPHLCNYYECQVKYCKVLEMNISKQEMEMSSFKNSIYSEKYKFIIKNNNNNNRDSESGGRDGNKQKRHYKKNKNNQLSFKFRCFQKDGMFRGFFAVTTLPKNVSQIDMNFGILFPQICLNKWDRSILSNNQLYKGSSLFEMDSIANLDIINVKLCFQVMTVCDLNGEIIE